jgi:subtilisin family serine protease
VLVLGVAGIAFAATAVLAGQAWAEPATGQIRLAGGATAVNGEYIVVFKDTAVGATGVDTAARRLTARHGGAVRGTWKDAVRGFEIATSEKAARRLAADPTVDYVEQNHIFSIDATQTPATWGLDRIDQANLPLNNSYTYPTTAANVHAYIIDTGIRRTHAQFTGRVGNGFDAVTAGGSANDCNGHGTHVAGTVGGTTYGVAKQVTLHPVRVLSCSGSGSTAGVVNGINWVTANRIRPAVANMSLGGGTSSALDAAVNNSINAGVTYAIAAGNSNANACNFSPARVPAAITVGATTRTDARSSFSNIGTCVDIFAPGSSITSAWNTSNTATNTISGTSMATPHVTGAAALVLSANPTFTPAQVRARLVTNATSGALTGVGSGSPNRLLRVR